MANYCYNSLDISGSVEDIKKLEEFIKNRKENDGGGEKYSLDGIISIETDERGFYKLKKGESVYDLWGTKWVADIDFENCGVIADMRFDTEWSPSLPITLEMSKKFNLKINHYYEESGCDFEGDYEVDNGVVISDKHGSYRPDCVECGEKFDRDKMIYNDDECEYYCIACGDEFTGIVMEKIEMIKTKEVKNGTYIKGD